MKGYDWCITNWGTKWNAKECYWADIIDEVAILNFTTAWQPPKPIIYKLSEMFPDLEFTLEYNESGLCFNGIYNVVKSKVLIDECLVYTPDNDEMNIKNVK